jgi:tryptophanyl-tRNA synthetase
MTLYHIATGKTFAEIEKEFEGQGYGVFKPAVAEALDICLAPVRERMNGYLSNAAQLDTLIREGAEKANAAAAEILKRVHNAVGFVCFR